MRVSEVTQSANVYAAMLLNKS